MKYFFCLVFFFTAHHLIACECIRFPGQDYFKMADLVLIGEVVEMDTILIPMTIGGVEFKDYKQVKCLIKASQLYKGPLDTMYVEILTTIGGGECGYFFERGKTYMIYANSSGKLAEFAPYFTSNCSNTHRITKQEAEERKYCPVKTFQK